jgi:putative chitinase
MSIEGLQRALIAQGYDCGPAGADGDLGGYTLAALISFSANRQLGGFGLDMGRAANRHFSFADIDTRQRICGFIAQGKIETDSYRTLQEYGGPTYFARYEGRADLGNTQPGDGARFHGRGILQVTGRYNYRVLGAKLGIELEAHPDLLATPDIGTKAACLYWVDKGLNAFCDAGNWAAVSRGINRGNPRSPKPANHEAERLAATERLLKVWPA